MSKKIVQYLSQALSEIREAGLFKEERVIQSPQGVHIQVNGETVLNFCANNYLGLASHPALIQAGKGALERWGYGMSSVRFICGTQEQHKQLEQTISGFLGAEDTLLYSSCFDANAGVFETLLGEEDAIISDKLNHASIIDGVRLCKAERHVYEHNDMSELEEILKKTQEKRFRIVATDGVFSMDGEIADLKAICDLAERYDALVMVDDSHATGFIGAHGRGTPEYCEVEGRIDILTSTLGKALGGASGGFITGKKEVIAYLRQRSRPYLFSNTLAPVIVGASIKVFEMLKDSRDLIRQSQENTMYFRTKIAEAGFELGGREHPIIPVMLYDEKKAGEMARRLLAHKIYVIGFSYPVVPKGKARIRVQISAAHTQEDLDRCIDAFKIVGKEMGVIS